MKIDKMLTSPTFWTYFAILSVVWLVVAGYFHPIKHHLLVAAPSNGGNLADYDSAKAIVQFEVTYFQFLAGITVPIIAGLFAVLLANSNQDDWRYPALAAANLLCLALALVTCGYAIRNGWMMQQRPSWGPLVGADAFFLGPLTAISYAVAIGMLVRMAFLGLPDIKPPSNVPAP